MILCPAFSRRDTVGERQWSLLLPVWRYSGRGYDVLTDSFKQGPWQFSIRLTVAKSIQNISFRLSWGSSYVP